MDIKSVLRQVDRVKFKLMITKKSTFFSSLLTGLRIEYINDIECAATDGISLFLNPTFVSTLDEDELLGLIMHELGHNIFEHIIICYTHKLNPEIHNMAGDHYINLWLLTGGYTLPKSVAFFADRKYVGWSTMKIYKDLLQNPSKQPQNYTMDILPAPKGMTKQEHLLKVTNNIMKAVIQAELADNIDSIPSEVLMYVNKIRNPELPWEQILANYMDTYAPDDYTWSRPNKRYLPQFWMPTLRSLHMGQMTVGMDVSGSTTGKVLSLQVAEVKYFWDTLKPESLHLMTFDVNVHLNKMYKQGDSLDDVELHGGGATCLRQLFTSIQAENPVIALIFTDGYVSVPDMSKIESDIIWIITNNPAFKASKGKIIHCNIQE